MKIRGTGSDAAQDAAVVQRQQTASQQEARRSLATNLGNLALGKVSGEDKISVSLGHAIQEQIDSLAFDPKRRDRVNELKQLVQSGQYNPPIPEVARAVGEDIVFEILSQSGSPEQG